MLAAEPKHGPEHANDCQDERNDELEIASPSGRKRPRLAAAGAPLVINFNSMLL